VNGGCASYIAEDNPVNQHVALRLLEKHGHTVIVANNGREALDACRASVFDAVLMDVQMPVMNGLEAAAGIRAFEAEQGTEQRMPIIALTAHAMHPDMDRCLQAGMDLYLSKPYRAQDLLSTIEDAVKSAPRRLDGAILPER
jgi:two-component system, sensor histidine kinase and response regulator